MENLKRLKHKKKKNLESQLELSERLDSVEVLEFMDNLTEYFITLV